MGMKIDINCDLGELGDSGNDEAIMPWITSANIACGGHAGNRQLMEKTILLAKKYGVSIGAHPGYPDRMNFGRKPISMTMMELRQAVMSQVSDLKILAEAYGQRLEHVKPHGAMYNSAAIDPGMAFTIAMAVRDIDSGLKLVGPPGSELKNAANDAGLEFLNEVFADRAYNDDGTLVSRNIPGAILHDMKTVIDRAVKMVSEGRVESISGKLIPIEADTICIHGDDDMAPGFARNLSTAFRAAGVKVISAGKTWKDA